MWWIRTFLSAIWFLFHGCHGNVGRWDVFNIKTPYIWAHHDLRADQIRDQSKPVTIGNETCHVVHLNMVIRHGAKYPSTYKERKITNIHERLLPFKDGPKYHEISNWINPFKKETASLLVPMGEREQQQLGERTGRRFHSLFTHYGQNVKFVSSSKTRAIDSSRNFYAGIKKSFDQMKFHKNDINNRVLRFYDRCKRRRDFWKDLSTNPWYYEILEFEKRPEFIQMREAATARLGLNFTLTADDVYLINDICAYDTYTSHFSHWCELLTDKERLILEYGRDLQDYYRRSYGRTINSEMACPLMRDMFYTMDEVIETVNGTHVTNSPFLAAKFQFGHSGTLIRLMTSLGLFKDPVPPLAINRDIMANRMFRTSNILSYSSNLAFVVYACGETDKNFRLRLDVNENTIRIPGCDHDLCPYEQVRRNYEHLIDRCNLFEICTPRN